MLAAGSSTDERPVLGLDLGGAHLKAALALGGRVVDARQMPCRLWEGLDRLEAALGSAASGLPPTARVALTMTGELADLFADRATGVRALIGAVRSHFSTSDLRVWAGTEGFLDPAAALDRAAAVASSNWLATGTLLARRLPAGVLVDIGSTTTDIILVRDGAVRFTGYRDRERLAAGELVYQGMTRTPAMAMAAAAPLGGRLVPLMNEHFATAADVWRVLGRLDEAHDQHAAADMGEKTPQASARRLARMLGADLADADDAAWLDVAGWLATAQLRRIEDAIRLCLSRAPLPKAAPLVGAGCGRALLPELGRALGRPVLDIAELLPATPHAAAMAATCAPAAAVALLLAEDEAIASRTAVTAAG